MRIILEVRSNRIAELVEGMRGRAEEAVAKATLDAEAYAKGAVAVDTGNLRNSIVSNIDGLTGTVSTGVDYAVFQEYGTSRMPAHPYMIPAIEAVTSQFLGDMQDIFNG